ncbi:hypothetical protein APD35_09160 [Acinetobacter pittii]|uniref:DUF4236 domain-containing protein n=1 Tax=Acinetobacter calcoaceticus/baumannii complex TaxID=909768 RepID=UPI0007072232|nr:MULTISPECIES: DUF4236 domain-containing protein [Acinetobacter calcoaceticus/baumannii complex]KQE08171.1 hypothetical protein APD35_09160 [Acinetobacter pittii]KRI44254.1 hypothetical protein APC31_02985 [Acinetobacter baumannii]TPS78721.1 DUF4236 domain-containing protein [Acinetobacter baumannii]
MGLNFRKSIKIAPGVRVNISKKGVSSVSVGGKGARVNVSKKGTRTTVGLPGTGLSYSKFSSHTKKTTRRREPDFNNPDNVWGYPKSEWIICGIILFIALMIFIWIIS